MLWRHPKLNCHTDRALTERRFDSDDLLFKRMLYVGFPTASGAYPLRRGSVFASSVSLFAIQMIDHLRWQHKPKRICKERFLISQLLNRGIHSTRLSRFRDEAPDCKRC